MRRIMVRYRCVALVPDRYHAKEIDMSETSRVILALRAAGWDEKDISDFILWVETGEEQYKPKGNNK